MKRLYNDADYDISVVVPCYDEELNVEPLHEGLRRVLDELTDSYEIIYVDDGSKDRTFEVLSRLHECDPKVKVVRFRRNFGQTPALAAGFDYARGSVVVAIDADLQFEPGDIPRLIEKLDEGYDIVSGWRENRKHDSFLIRRFPSLVANRIMANVSGVRMHDFGSTLKAYRSDIVHEIKLYGEMHRFIPALASSVGARIAEIPVQIKLRQFGKSKYGFSRTWRVMLDIIMVKFLISYLKQPLRLFGLTGLLMSSSGIGTMAYLSYLKWGLHDEFRNHQPLLLLSILFVVLGVQFISLGLIAEVLTRTYHEAQGKAIYSVRQILGDAHPTNTAHVKTKEHA